LKFTLRLLYLQPQRLILVHTLAVQAKTTFMPESSPTYRPGTAFGSFVSQSDDPLALLTNTPVIFRGYAQGGSSETRGDACLVGAAA